MFHISVSAIDIISTQLSSFFLTTLFFSYPNKVRFSQRISIFISHPSSGVKHPMAVNKIACKSSKFRVVFTFPNFCWPPPPTPPSVPPIPFPLFADFGGAKSVAKDIRRNRKFAFVFKASKTDKTYGDEIALPGRKGVKAVPLPNRPGRCVILPRLKFSNAISCALAIRSI